MARPDIQDLPIATRLRYRLEALLLRGLLSLLLTMGRSKSAAIGSWLARVIGPLTSAHKTGLANLAMALPGEDHKAIMQGVWDNLGRVVGEYPHMKDFRCYGTDADITITGAEWIDQLRDDGKAGIFFSAHYGNWEILSAMAAQKDCPLTLVYREANNPLAEEAFQTLRDHGRGELYVKKGKEGARALIKAIRNGQHLGLLLDQKQNDGLPVDFFGKPAMTAPAAAELALRFNLPMVPVRVIRTGPNSFRAEVLPPLTLPDSGDRKQDLEGLLSMINGLFEDWIREYPEQWFWVHKRWPK